MKLLKKIWQLLKLISSKVKFKKSAKPKPEVKTETDPLQDLRKAVKKLRSKVKRSKAWWLVIGPESFAAKDVVYLEVKPEAKAHKYLAKLLKKYHLGKYLQGILAVYDVDALNQPNAELRRQIQYLMRKLKTRIPVSLIVNKCDKLSGFKEFYAKLSAEEQQQLWGITFSDAEVMAQFTNGYVQLQENISDYLLTKIQAEHRYKVAISLSDLVYQFANLATTLRQFISNLLTVSAWETAVKLQACYFVSAEPKQQPYFNKQKYREPTVQLRRRRKFRAAMVYVFSAMVLLLVAIIYPLEYSHAKRDNLNLQQQLATTINLAQLNNAIAEFNTHSQTPIKVGLYAERQMQHTLIQVQQHQFLPYILSILEQDLRATMHDPQRLYATLKTYLMLGQPQRLDKQTVILWFADQHQKLTSQVQNLLAHPLPKTPLNSKLIAGARAKLNRLSLARQAYISLQQQATELETNALDLSNIDNFNQVFINKQPHVISQLYTATGYKQLYQTQAPTSVDTTIKNDWVLGVANNAAPLQTKVTGQLQNIYLQDYSDCWHQQLASIKIIPCKNLSQLVQVLALLDSDASPVAALLQTTNSNTAIAPAVARSFASLNQVKPDALQKPIQVLHDYLQTITKADDPKQAAWQAAAVIMANKPTPIQQLQQQAQNYPAPISNWLNALATQSLQLIMQQAGLYVQTKWDTEVYPAYKQTIQLRYPFKYSHREVSLEDFTAFFAPKGVVDKFYQSYVQPFVSQDGSKLKWRRVDGHAIALSNNFLQKIGWAEQISQTYFVAAKPQLDFTLKPIFLDNNVAAVDLNINGQQLNYHHGPEINSNISWPAKLGDNNIHIGFKDLNGHRTSLHTSGLWSFYKLLDTQKMRGSEHSTITTLKINIHNRHAFYQIQTTTANNPWLLLQHHDFYLPYRIM